MMNSEWVEFNQYFWQIPDLAVGLEVEFNNGDRYIVGSINDQGGTCNCCNVIDFDVVKRYRRIFDAGALQQ
jgi:hypothetical protein